MNGLRCAAIGSVSAIALSPMAAVLVAIVYRFPIPLTGYESGLDAAWPAVVGAVFYLVLGGFLVVGGLGAIAGWAAARLHPDRAVALTMIAAAVIAVLGALSLAVLEYFIGHW
ncbi:hypothetical protein [Mycobacteroides saopaulense]|uniref:Uncharacterized protein n=1 Tax=Mycobacteroides saopaulense TaxID=1578165 RepID=A0A1S1JHK0_9MYCO|nr:hypothetical protein [Mycobacteroides saopaulense]ALR10229.1 hypothetical protein MYCSP_00700 [Mycobacteroides saopaulense]OHT83050.1 hypothetical protein BKG68_16715 [Mycobacteroides saopaulense]OHU09751.1 hypothetical protein BKG73_11380 [Mycobacteroides saopaulense]ORB48251.1 hypothetical protein BST43_25100 [Mycobacteroides saopaulense]